MADHRQSNKPKVTLPSQNSTETIISIVLGLFVLAIIATFAYSFYRNWRENRSQNQEVTEQSTPAPIVVEELPTQVETETDQETGREVPKNLPAQYTVKPGDTSWQIAEAFYGSGFNYIDIEDANQLERDTELNVGMELTIPRVPVRTAQEAGQPLEYIQHEGSDREIEPGAHKGGNWEDSQASDESAAENRE